MAAASSAQAQSSKFEISAVAGWTFSDGVDGPAVAVPGEGTFNRIDPKDSFSWGLRFGYLLTENHEIGALFDMQPTQLELSGTGTATLGDINIFNYHAYYAYTFLNIDAVARPYLLIGLGATNFSSVDVTLGDTPQSVGGSTEFSGTLAGGVKVFPFASPKFGFRAEARWTPTYITSDPGGVWCDPYWGCYFTGNFQNQARPNREQYSSQIEISGAVTKSPSGPNFCRPPL